jgi:predicted transcriptional regulator of viral defense system
MNKIYKEMYQNKLFTLQEATKIIKDNQVCRNNINRLVKQKLITRLKAGIYYINPLDNQGFYPDTIHIASKLRPDAVISANSALRVLNQTNRQTSINEPTIYLSAKHSSRLRIDKHTYKIIKGFNFGIDKIEYQTPYGKFEIKVTDLERTIIDCLRTRSLKGEELLNILKAKQSDAKQLEGKQTETKLSDSKQQEIKPVEINFRKITTYLEKYNMPILYSKVGLMLELCKTELKIDSSDIDKLRKKLSKKIFYFKERGIKLIRPRYHYYKEWNIMLPEHLFEMAKSMRPQVAPVQTIVGK